MTTTTDPIAAARALAPAVRAAADETEQARTLAPHVVRAFVDARLFDLVLPEVYGGLQADPLTMVRVVEEISAADGASGWALAIGLGTAVLAAFVPEAVARDVFAPGAVTGGPVSPLGRALPDAGGYRLTGRWPFSSGVPHCDWMACGGFVFEGDRPRMVGPAPDWRLFLVSKRDIEVVDTWRVSGLRGTGSHDIAINGAIVPEDHTVPFGTAKPVVEAPLYHFPLIPFLATTIAGVATGVARRAIDELVALAQKKTPTGSPSTLAKRAVAQSEIALAEATLGGGRAFLFETVGDAWTTLCAGSPLSTEQRARVRLAAAHATACAARATDIAYTLGGGTSIYDTHALQRCFRDVHVATQHIALAPANYELAGQVIFGLPVAGPL